MGRERPGNLTACRTILFFFPRLPFPGWDQPKVCSGSLQQGTAGGVFGRGSRKQKKKLAVIW